MACYNMSIIKIFKNVRTGKCKTVYFSNVNKNLRLLHEDEGKEITYYRDKLTGFVDKYILDRVLYVPCNNCIGCALDHAKDWQNRLVMESIYTHCNYFLTLTYNDDNLPLDMQLKKDDIKKFIKDLRNYYKNKFGYDGIRYYVGAEYGSKSARPHYHIILFNCPLTSEDFSFLKIKFDGFKFINVGKSISGDKIYSVSLFTELWKKGFNVVGSFSKATAGYVARYVNKKKLLTRDEKKELRYSGIQPEFNLMSKGIGKQFLLDNFNKILDNNLSIYLNGDLISVDRYFYKIVENFGTENQKEKLAKSKVSRQIMAGALEANQARLYDDDKNLMFNDLQNKKLNHIKSLKRKF